MSTHEFYPLFPDVEVKLTGEDGNAFFTIARVKTAMKLSGKCEKADIQSFQAEAMSGDYDHVLQTCMKWVTVL